VLVCLCHDRFKSCGVRAGYSLAPKACGYDNAATRAITFSDGFETEAPVVSTRRSAAVRRRHGRGKSAESAQQCVLGFVVVGNDVEIIVPNARQFLLR